MEIGPREILTPFRPIPLEVPEGMKPNEFFNSTENLNDLVHNNGLLLNREDLLLYRKALGHSNEFDCSIIYNTSKTILNPLGRPVRRTQVPEAVRRVWNRMNQVIIGWMVERYPDPARDPDPGRRGEPGRDLAPDLPGVPSIRMLHNHFMAFPMDAAALGGPGQPGQPEPDRRGPAQPVPGLHARRLPGVLRRRPWTSRSCAPCTRRSRAWGSPATRRGCRAGRSRAGWRP